MDQLRLFIAIELPSQIKDALENIQAGLKVIDQSGAKWVNPNGIHLTLKFLGSTDPVRVEAIVTAIKDAAKGIPPFDLQIKGLGAFPNLRRVQVIWVGLDGQLEILQSVQKKIESNMVPLGFPAEKRAFTPHLTLARLHESTDPLRRQALGEAVAKAKIESNLIINVKSINLMRSQLTRAGAIYTCLSSIELNPPCH